MGWNAYQNRNEYKKLTLYHSTTELTSQPWSNCTLLLQNMSEEQELSTELGKLVSACPHVEQFELIGAGFRSAFSKRYISEEMQHFVPW